MPSLVKLFPNIARAISVPLHPREDIVISGAGSSVGSGVWVPVDGGHIANITVSGAAYSLTWRLLACRAGSAVVEQIPFRRKSDLSILVSQRAVANEQAIFEADVAGYEAVRLDCTAYTSGTMNWEISTSVSPQPSGGLIKPEPVLQSITAFGVANTAVNLTLPAAGVGLTHILRRLTVKAINGTATAVAASAIIQVASTNLPGARTWRRENNFPAWSSAALVDENWALGLRASAANTATVISVPILGVGVQAEITADYTLGR